MLEELQPKRPWYRHWWGVVIILLLALLGVIFIYFLTQVYSFYTRIKSGEISTAEYIFEGKFTTSESLRRSLAPSETDVDLTTTDDPQFGEPDAPLTIVEFADFGCPYSAEEAFIVRELVAEFPTLIRYVYRDFPIDELHPNAHLAAEAGECAKELGNFWALHDKIYQNQNDLSRDALIRYAREIGLDEDAFADCLDSGKYRAEVEEDIAAGTAAGVRGTPTFFLNGKRIEGAIPRDVWSEIIAAMLQ